MLLANTEIKKNRHDFSCSRSLTNNIATFFSTLFCIFLSKTKQKRRVVIRNNTVKNLHNYRSDATGTRSIFRSGNRSGVDIIINDGVNIMVDGLQRLFRERIIIIR